MGTRGSLRHNWSDVGETTGLGEGRAGERVRIT